MNCTATLTYEWVDLFRNAEKVITGTFHGTVFSIKYNKSVLCYPTEKNRINKIIADKKTRNRILTAVCAIACVAVVVSFVVPTVAQQFSNIIKFNLITNFVLPKELSVESYATIKTFQLYVSYAGLFHFGFVDGMYLKYGGKNIKELRREDLGTNLSTLRLFEIVVTIVCAIIAIISKQEVLVFFSLSILPLNLANYFKQLYQATGEFSLYGKIMNANTILIFFANMIWIFLIKTDSQ